MGIPVEDIIIDPLVMTVGHNSNAALVTLETIRLIKKEYGVNISLGASNVSFGLPDRHSVNSAFLALAMQAGATCSITDPIKLGSCHQGSGPAARQGCEFDAVFEIFPCDGEAARPGSRGQGLIRTFPHRSNRRFVRKSRTVLILLSKRFDRRLVLQQI